MPGPLALTTVSSVLNWVGSTNTANEALIQSIIDRVSPTIMGFLGREALISRAYAETYDAIGGRRLMLRQFPVTSIQSLTIGTQSVPVNPNPPVGAGYYLDPWDGLPPGRVQFVTLSGYVWAPNSVGYVFERQKASIFVNYTAGYLIPAEAQTIPSSGYQVVPTQPYGLWAADGGVAYANGTKLTAVPQGTTPSVGQYVPPNPFGQTVGANSATTYYQFAAADANASVVLTYSYIPSGVEGVAAQFAAEQYSYRTRIGIKTESQSGAVTASFYGMELQPWAKEALQPYRRTVPL